MSNRYYDTSGQRAAKVQSLFGVIAPSYDLVNDLQSLGLHRYWKAKMISMAEPKEGEIALDVCCGTGDLAFALIRRGVATAAVDFSLPMLAVGRQRSAKLPPKDAERLRWLCGDAQNLPFADAQFDIVCVGYGLRNLVSWQRGVEEMWRVTKPGGRLLILEFGKPANPFWRRLYEFYLKCGIPIFGRIFSGDAATYAYILESLKEYPDQSVVMKKLQDLQGGNLRLVPFLGGVMTIHAATKS